MLITAIINTKINAAEFSIPLAVECKSKNPNAIMKIITHNEGLNKFSLLISKFVLNTLLKKVTAKSNPLMKIACVSMKDTITINDIALINVDCENTGAVVEANALNISVIGISSANVTISCPTKTNAR